MSFNGIQFQAVPFDVLKRLRKRGYYMEVQERRQNNLRKICDELGIYWEDIK